MHLVSGADLATSERIAADVGVISEDSQPDERYHADCGYD